MVVNLLRRSILADVSLDRPIWSDISCRGLIEIESQFEYRPTGFNAVSALDRAGIERMVIAAMLRPDTSMAIL